MAGIRVLDRVCAAAAALGMGGCAALLPVSESTTLNGWRSFEEAREAIERIVPYRSTRTDLRTLGIDPAAGSGITILTFSDVIQRFNTGAVLGADELDTGIRDCLRAGKRCTAYSILQRTVKRDRNGNFFLDSLNFKRDTDISGWTFNALIVFVDDRVVYTLYGGQPNVKEQEITRNPLGPLQGWGDGMGALLR